MTSKLTFYHGTDARTVRMSAEKRKEHKEFCKMVATSLRRYFPAQAACMDLFKQPLDYDSDPTTFDNLINAINVCDGMLNDSSGYNYNYFHVHTWKETASNYAYRSFAFGEMGLIAYRMLDVCLKMGLKKWGSYPLGDFCKRIIDFAEAEPEPVVFALDDLDLNCMETMNGQKLLDSKGELRRNIDNIGMAFRYAKEVHLDLSNAIYLKK